MEAVEVEPVEADLRGAVRQRVVEVAQPADEVCDDRVAPHPHREPAEAAERLLRRLVLAGAADEAVHAVGIRPVRLDRDRGAAAVGDQALRDLRAFAVELVGPVRRLAEQYVTDAICARQQGRVVVPGRGERAQDAVAVETSGDRWTAGAGQQVAYLLIARLREILVPQPDGAPWLLPC